MSYQPGEVAGNYPIITPIGAGGMGAVYKVRNVIRIFADSVKDTLHLSGLEVNFKVVTGKTGTGFALFVNEKKSLPKLAQAILDSFSKSGVRLALVAEVQAISR